MNKFKPPFVQRWCGFAVMAGVALLAACTAQSPPSAPVAARNAQFLAAEPLPADGKYRVSFDGDKAVLDATAQKVVDRVAISLKNDATLRVTIGAKRDLVGSAAAKTRLSERRAESVRDALIATGSVTASRIDMVWPEVRKQEGAPAANTVGFRNWVVDVTLQHAD